MTILQVDKHRCLALCADERGDKSSVEIALVEAYPGDSVLVHAGVALVRLEDRTADSATESL